MDLSVIIVSYNTKQKLEQCLRSVFASRCNFSYEVWVVDNASSDGSGKMVREEFPQARLIVNQENLGYAKANNIVLRPASPSGRQAEGKYLLLLNSDVEVAQDTFDKMLVFMDNNEEVGIAGCRVVKDDGKLDLACRRSFPNPRAAFYRITGLSFLFPKSRLASYNLTYLPEDRILEVDSVMGAFLMIRKAVVEKIGLLDEDFFMYGEDLDWCFRTKAAGFKVMYVPLTTVIHHKGSSSRQAPGKALYEFHRAMQVFYDKHYRSHNSMFLNLLVKTTIWLRYAFKFLVNFLRHA